MNPNNRSGEPQWWVTVFKYNTLLESCFQLQVVSVSDYASKLQVFLTMQASFKCFWLCKQVSSVSDNASKFQTMQASFKCFWLCKQVSSVSDYASKSQVFLTMQASKRKKERGGGGSGYSGSGRSGCSTSWHKQQNLMSTNFAYRNSEEWGKNSNNTDS